MHLSEGAYRDVATFAEGVEYSADGISTPSGIACWDFDIVNTGLPTFETSSQDLQWLLTGFN